MNVPFETPQHVDIKALAPKELDSVVAVYTSFPFDTLNSAKYKVAADVVEPKRFISDSLKSLGRRVQSYGDDLKSAIKDLVTGEITQEDVIFTYYNIEEKRDPQELLKIINSSVEENSRYNPEFFERRFSEWGNRLIEEVREDRNYANKIEEIQRKLFESDYRDRSSLTFRDEKTTPTSYVLIANPNPTSPQENLQLFNRIHLQPENTISVVFVQYNLDDSEEKRYFKIADYAKETFKDLHVGVQNKANTFYIRFVISQFSYTVEYTPGQDVIIPLRMVNYHTFIEGELRRFFPGAFGAVDTARYRRVFTLTNATFNEQALADMVLIQPQFRNFFYLDERDKPLARKEHFILHYRGEYLNLPNAGKGKDSRAEVILSNHLLRAALGEEKNEISISIDKADSVILLDRITALIKILLNYYIVNAEPLIRFYRTAFGDEKLAEIKENEIVEEKKQRVVSRKGTRKLYHLRAAVPDLFPRKTYSQACSADKQPTMIPEDKASSYEKGRVISIPPLNQPPIDGKRYFFTCESSKYPYPSVIANADLKTRDKFPVVPCCAHSIQTEPGGSYYRYTQGNIRTRGPARGEKIISTGKILGTNARGVLPESIARILQTVLPQGVERLGVPRSLNSLLHCVCLAIEDEDYTAAANREDYVANLRQRIAQAVHPGVYAQELYDRDRSLFNPANSNLFYDPALYYRGIEEFFTINIYTFVTDGIEIPRYKALHAHALRKQRKTVLVFKNSGTGLDPDQKVPQCELIISPRVSSIYDEQVTTLCHNILMEQVNFLTWGFHQNRGRNSFFYAQDYYELFHEAAYAQFIDSYGKLRALFFRLPTNKTMIIVLPPGQPVNLPVKNLNESLLITLEDLRNSGLNFINNPTAQSMNKSGETIGLHYEFMGLSRGIFIPIKSTLLREEKIPIIPDPIGTLADINPHRLSHLQRTLDIIVQLVKYLYLLHRKSGESEASFVKYFTINENKDVDSAVIYDLSRIEYKLPTGTLNEVMDAFEQQVPTLISHRKIIAYNRDFFNKLLPVLHLYEKMIWAKLADPAPQYINNYYNENTFSHVIGTKIFIGQRNFLLWLEQILHYDPTVKTTITSDLVTTDDPFVFFDKNESRYYLIQNTNKEQSYKRAITIATIWQREGRNSGSSVIEEVKGAVLPEFIYQINSEGGINLIHKAPGPDGPTVIRLLQVSKDNYSALLPLL